MSGWLFSIRWYIMKSEDVMSTASGRNVSLKETTKHTDQTDYDNELEIIEANASVDTEVQRLTGMGL